MNKNAKALIEDEFGCYYLADELDNVNGPSFLARIDEMAAESAQRIVWSGGSESAAPVAGATALDDGRWKPRIARATHG